MLKRLLRNTRLKISSAVSLGKRKSRLFLPGKEKHAGGIATTKPVDEGKKETVIAVKDSEKNNRGAENRPQQRVAKKKKWSLDNYQVVAVPGKVRFHDIGLPLSLMRAIADLKFDYCTPVQAESLPHILEGKDLVGNANTGTGKTAVFLISILSRLLRQTGKKRDNGVKALIIAPTRELAIQITKDGKKLCRYCNIRIVAVYGGSDYRKQMDFLQKNRCDIVVATPGRLLDFAQKKVLNLQHTEILVIDEADRMLDMGFIPDVRRIVNLLPDKRSRQTLMFSATITDEVKRLASQWCKNPMNVAIEPEQVAVESVDQKVYLVTKSEKYTILYNLIQKSGKSRIVVFANQKVDAKKLHERLKRNGINCTLLTGDVPQKKRMDRLERFRSGRVQILVATDVAGRGIHIDGITHVVNYTLPYEPEDYVHRIGRTGRAGAAGVSISFACEEGGFVLPDIEEFIGKKLNCVVPEEDLLKEPPKGRGGKIGKTTEFRKKKPRKRTYPPKRH